MYAHVYTERRERGWLIDEVNHLLRFIFVKIVGNFPGYRSHILEPYTYHHLFVKVKDSWNEKKCVMLYVSECTFDVPPVNTRKLFICLLPLQ